MATIIQAFREYGPRIEHGRTVGLEEVSTWLSSRSGLNPAEIEMVLKELRAAVIYFGRMGTPVSLPGVGRVRMSLGRDGRFRVNTTADRQVVQAMNAPGTFTGSIRNRANIGLDNAGYKELWDAAHPEDPLEIPAA